MLYSILYYLVVLHCHTVVKYIFYSLVQEAADSLNDQFQMLTVSWFNVSALVLTQVSQF